MSKKAWIVFIVVAVGVLTLLVATARHSDEINLDGVDASSIQPASDQNGQIADHVFGKTESTVTLIEYGDYQCGPCGSAYQIVHPVVEDYKDKIRFVFRNFPIPTLHPNALIAASVGEAAGLQGKFWEMHDLLYESQGAWENITTDERIEYFAGLATQLGLDRDQFISDLSSNSIAAKIKFDKALGEKAGVQGTPTFILNGTKLSGSQYGNADNLKKALDSELEKTAS